MQDWTDAEFHELRERLTQVIDEIIEENGEEGFSADLLVGVLNLQIARIAMMTDDPEFCMSKWNQAAADSWRGLDSLRQVHKLLGIEEEEDNSET